MSNMLDKGNILNRAIDRAVENGLSETNARRFRRYGVCVNVFFDHEFAKTFWGTEWKDGDVIETPMSEILAQENIKPWQHHLKRMVLEEEPAEYIEKFL